MLEILCSVMMSDPRQMATVGFLCFMFILCSMPMVNLCVLLHCKKKEEGTPMKIMRFCQNCGKLLIFSYSG